MIFLKEKSKLFTYIQLKIKICKYSAKYNKTFISFYLELANDVEEDLEDVNNDIEIKTKLIQQLELSQQRMQLMRQQYEDKLMLLSSQVINTQKERDEVLSFIGKSKWHETERTNVV